MRTSARVFPVPPAEWTEEQRALIKPSMHKDRAPNLYTTLARHPAAMHSFVAMGGHIRNSSLPQREKEILILRTGWLSRSGYEWNAHNRLGQRAGLTKTEIAGIAEGSTSAILGVADRLLCRAAEEIHADQFISDLTWKELRSHWSEAQCVDLVFTVGYYVLVCALLNSLGIQFDPGASLDADVRSAWGV